MILVLGRLRQEDLKFQAMLRYIVRSCLKKIKRETNQKIKRSWVCKCLSIISTLGRLRQQSSEEFRLV